MIKYIIIKGVDHRHKRWRGAKDELKKFGDSFLSPRKNLNFAKFGNKVI